MPKVILSPSLPSASLVRSSVKLALEDESVVERQAARIEYRPVIDAGCKM